jgi:hypothetical protein
MKRNHFGNFLGVPGLLLLFVASCKTPESEQSAFRRDLGQALEAMEAEPGPCEVCGQASDSKEDRRTLVLDDQLIEFCCMTCAEEFYEDPNWRQYEKK